MKKRGLILVLLMLLGVESVKAEYRAFLIEVYDHILKKKWEERTGFSPDKYVLTHGGGNRLSVFIKATWMCYGDTSGYTPACPIPDPVKPLFQKGQRVRVNLEKHITKGWVGIVELAYYRSRLKSNVYGVRFGEKRQLYNQYYEFNLEKAESVITPQTSAAEAFNQSKQPGETAAP